MAVLISIMLAEIIVPLSLRYHAASMGDSLHTHYTMEYYNKTKEVKSKFVIKGMK